MKKPILILGIGSLVLLLLSGCQEPVEPTPAPKVHIGSQSWAVEVVSTPEDRSVGLMGRTNLDYKEGMVFIFEENGKHGFWMKNTLIPLDIIWISDQMEVVAIRRNTPPCGEEKSQADLCTMYIPQSEARYALEVRAKTFSGSLGDPVRFNWTKRQ